MKLRVGSYIIKLKAHLTIKVVSDAKTRSPQILGGLNLPMSFLLGMLYCAGNLQEHSQVSFFSLLARVKMNRF